MREQTADDLNWLMSDKRGRRVIHGLLGECGIYRQSYTPGDTHATSFLEGVRSVGLKLMGRISEHCPGRMSEMFKEVKANGPATDSK
ncbi:hypothetical protein APR50_10515 [Variovorax paradoxus]|nr:hypothetical protein APR50_10515 [Variovorax paradoxus]KPV11392.1 hypothetical protein APR49_09390 [Variovorax paradoxus]KPV23284.1 hypothetical protein APR51_07965 [Variovorax paradoxus]KPV31150.1 hypothetical protein APR48_17640 [Variovorax paradoxus]KPV33243.1 hypothetical protein APR47_18025 [Variovorax paradoxus]